MSQNLGIQWAPYKKSRVLRIIPIYIIKAAVPRTVQSDFQSEHRELVGFLAQLREDYRIVLVLRFFEDLSPVEAARAMRRSAGAVRVLQHRALAALKELLETHLEDG